MKKKLTVLMLAFTMVFTMLAATACGGQSEEKAEKTDYGEGYEFTTTFSWFMLGRGVMDFIYYFSHPSWRQRFKYVSKHNGKRLYAALGISQLIFLFAEFAGRYALIIGTPALVSVVSNALEMILVFVLGIILSIIVPKFGREKLSRHIVIAHLVATVLAVVGIVLLN